MKCSVKMIFGMLFAAGSLAAADYGPTDDGSRSGQVIVRMNAPVSSAAGKTGISSVDAVIQKLGGRTLRPLLAPGHGRTTEAALRLERTYVVEYSSELSSAKAAFQLSKLDAVEFAEPAPKYYVDDLRAGPVDWDAIRRLVPNDPQYPSQTELTLPGFEAAWDVVKGEDSDVVIAIVDTGTDWRHPDLIDNIWTNPGEIADNGVDDDNNGFVDDIHGWNYAESKADPTPVASQPVNGSHGTAVAGVAAAVANNGVGVAGVSWGAKFMPVNIANPLEDRAVAFGLSGIVYAARNGADIINCSWGGPGEPSVVFQDVMTFAQEEGALVIGSAGNGGDDGFGDDLDEEPHYPSNFQTVISVGATNRTTDVAASYSNFGTSVDVFAPGTTLTTAPDNQYQSAGGTSFAAPMTAGLAALVWSTDRTLTNDQVAAIIKGTVDKIDDNNPQKIGKVGRGRINAGRAVTERSFPAFVLRESRIADANEKLTRGETSPMEIIVENVLAAGTGLTGTLAIDDPFVSVVTPSASLGAVSSGGQVTLSFDLMGSADLPTSHRVTAFLTITDGTTEDVMAIPFIANPPGFLALETGLIRTAVTTSGNIGWTGFKDMSPGVGFLVNGTDILFDGGLLVGTGVGSTSNSIRVGGNVRDTDFELSEDGAITFTSPGEVSDQEVKATFVDTGADNPLNIAVTQTAMATSRPGTEGFVLIGYEITNKNASALEGVYAGVFLDWDVELDAAGGVIDDAGWDGVRRMGWTSNSDFTLAGASAVMTTNTESGFRAIGNDPEIYLDTPNGQDGFTDEEKFSFLSGGVQTKSLKRQDTSTLISIGPVTIDEACSTTFGIALLGGTSLAALEVAADSAQAYWDSTVVPKLTNKPPGFTVAFADTAIQAQRRFLFDFKAGDPDACDELRFFLKDAPPNAFMNQATGQLNITPTDEQIGTLQFSVAVTDGVATATQDLTLTIDPFVVSNETAGEAFELALGPNFPNPFSSPTTIQATLNEPAEITIDVFDATGRRVTTLLEEARPAGRFAVTWSGLSSLGAPLPTGTYFVRMSGNIGGTPRVLTRPITLIR